jgi:peptidoglycan hydrolase-like protein with peptidoglycan-binding domain
VPNRDLADPRHARTSLRASLDRRLRRARRERAGRGGRRALALAGLTLCVAASGAFALSREETVAVQQKVGVTADGVVGPQTRAAIKRFQRANGLTPDGIVGPKTLAAMGLSEQPLAETPQAEEEAPAGDKTATLQAIAQCESGGDPTAVSPSGRYRGKYQFSRATWRSLGGTGDPAAAPEAEQDRMAALLLTKQGPSAWPNCA